MRPENGDLKDWYERTRVGIKGHLNMFRFAKPAHEIPLSAPHALSLANYSPRQTLCTQSTPPLAHLQQEQHTEPQSSVKASKPESCAHVQGRGQCVDTAGGKRQLEGVDPEPQTLKNAQDFGTCVSNQPCILERRSSALWWWKPTTRESTARIIHTQPLDPGFLRRGPDISSIIIPHAWL